MNILIRGLVVVGMLVCSSNAFAKDPDKCWIEGYQKGWCDARKKKDCVPPEAPVPPVAQQGREDCRSRMEDGYETGHIER